MNVINSEDYIIISEPIPGKASIHAVLRLPRNTSEADIECAIKMLRRQIEGTNCHTGMVIPCDWDFYFASDKPFPKPADNTPVKSFWQKLVEWI